MARQTRSDAREARRAAREAKKAKMAVATMPVRAHRTIDVSRLTPDEILRLNLHFHHHPPMTPQDTKLRDCIAVRIAAIRAACDARRQEWTEDDVAALGAFVGWPRTEDCGVCLTTGRLPGGFLCIECSHDGKPPIRYACAGDVHPLMRFAVASCEPVQ